MTSNFLSLNPAKTEFLLIGLPAQLSKIHNPTFTISSNTTIQPVSSAQNLGIIFDSNLSFSDHISYISKSCFSHIRDLRRIRNTLDPKTACTIATYLIHSKLDYCNSLYLNISSEQLNRLQLVLNSCCHKNSKIPSHYSSSQITSLAQNYATHTIQNSFTNLQVTSVQQTFLHFWSSHHTTNSFYPLICSCHSPTPFKSPIGSKFLTDLSTFKLLHFGMLYHTIFALILILLSFILFSHYLLLNSTSSWKLTFSFIPILLSLASLYWTDPLELWSGLFVIHYSFHFPHPRSVHLLNSF